MSPLFLIPISPRIPPSFSPTTAAVSLRSSKSLRHGQDHPDTPFSPVARPHFSPTSQTIVCLRCSMFKLWPSVAPNDAVRIQFTVGRAGSTAADVSSPSHLLPSIRSLMIALPTLVSLLQFRLHVNPSFCSFLMVTSCSLNTFPISSSTISVESCCSYKLSLYRLESFIR
jgi:hypothetical protein